jgi:hypothetical protein
MQCGAGPPSCGLGGRHGHDPVATLGIGRTDRGSTEGRARRRRSQRAGGGCCAHDWGHGSSVDTPRANRRPRLRLVVRTGRPRRSGVRRVLRTRRLRRRRGHGRRADLDAASGARSFGAFAHRHGRRGDRCGSCRRLRRRSGCGCRLRRSRRRRGCGGLGIGMWRGRRLGRRRREGGASRRKEREWVDVGLIRADADTEVDVGDGVLGLARRAGVGEDVPLRDRGAARHTQRAEMRQRHLGVGEDDRHGQPIRRDGSRERDLARDRRAHPCALAQGDVDAAVLTCGVLVAADGEAAEDGAVGRPRPGPRRRAGDER